MAFGENLVIQLLPISETNYVPIKGYDTYHLTFNSNTIFECENIDKGDKYILGNCTLLPHSLPEIIDDITILPLNFSTSNYTIQSDLDFLIYSK